MARSRAVLLLPHVNTSGKPDTLPDVKMSGEVFRPPVLDIVEESHGSAFPKGCALDLNRFQLSQSGADRGWLWGTGRAFRHSCLCRLNARRLLRRSSRRRRSPSRSGITGAGIAADRTEDDQGGEEEGLDAGARFLHDSQSGCAKQARLDCGCPSRGLTRSSPCGGRCSPLRCSPVSRRYLTV